MCTKYVIYRYLFDNGKCYIGQTNNIKSRIAYYINHFKKSHYPFLRALKKYGFEEHRFEAIALANNRNELNDLEIKFISFYQSNKKERGYNLSSGGGGMNGLSHTNVSKKKIGDAQRGGKSSMFGKHHSDEIKDKISKSLKGNIPWNKGIKYDLPKDPITKRVLNKGEKVPFLEFKNYEGSKLFLIDKSIKTQKEYFIFIKGKSSEYLIPANPRRFYRDSWVSWSDYLSNGSKKGNQGNEFLTYLNCIELLKENNIYSRNQYYILQKEKCYGIIPSNPDKFYKEWINWRVFLSKINKKEK